VTSELKAICESIVAPSESWRSRARAHLDTLTKPKGSLGRLEDLAAQWIAIRAGHAHEPLSKAVYVFAADHGVVAEGVSAYPSEVTRQMVLNFLAGGAAISVLARPHNVALRVVDVGVNGDFEPAANLISNKVRRGSRNMRQEPAMTEQEMIEAIEAGLRMAQHAAAHGHNLVAAGEMGIGNTTSASAITAVLTNTPVTQVTGAGTGLDGAARARKVQVIEACVAQHFDQVTRVAPIDVLRCVGGLEIAAMTGFYLGAAQHGMAIVCDGFISTSAAAIAVGIAPRLKGYLFAGHRSEEPGHTVLLTHLGLSPILDLGMRLGEGTGAVLAMPILESAQALYHQMATFASAGVSEAEP
jgi:nicotinate-nucleotide--dimethylbenzimidazole phosphoribosyltransferase